MISNQISLEFLEYKETPEPSLRQLFASINVPSVTFNPEKWVEKKMEQILPHVVEWRVGTLELFMNKNNKLVNQLEHIRFPRIKTLNLQGNYIQSIEGLSRMDLRLMETVYLFDNYIYPTHQLTKISWPSLDKFSFYNNKYLSLEYMPKGHLVQVTSLSLQWSKSDDPTCQNLSEVVKLETQNLSNLFILGGNRIGSARILQCLKRKYPSLDIKK